MGAEALIGAGVSIFGAGKAAKAQANAADSAAAAQMQMAREGIAAQAAMQEKALSELRNQGLTAYTEFGGYSQAGRRALTNYEYLTSGRQPGQEELYQSQVAPLDQQLALAQRQVGEIDARLNQIQQIKDKIGPAHYNSSDMEREEQQLLAQKQQFNIEKLQAARDEMAAQIEGGYQPISTEASPLYEMQWLNQQQMMEKRAKAQGLTGSDHFATQERRAQSELLAQERERQKNDQLQMMNVGQAGSAQIVGNMGGGNAAQIIGAGQGLPAQLLGDAGAGQAQAALISGAGAANVWGNIANLGTGMVQNYFNQQSLPSRPQASLQAGANSAANTIMGNPAALVYQMMPGAGGGYMNWLAGKTGRGM